MPAPPFTLNQLRIFLAVAHSRSMTHAAKLLAQTQPSLSQHIARLEDSIGQLLFERGRSRRVRPDLQGRCLRRLEALDHAESLTDLHVPGVNFHALQGVPTRYSIHVNGPWCITFAWEEGDALRVDLEQYH